MLAGGVGAAERTFLARVVKDADKVPLATPEPSPAEPASRPLETLAPTPELGAGMAEVQAMLSRAQRELVTSQNQVHRRFLEVAGRNLGGVLQVLPAAEVEAAETPEEDQVP